MRVGSQVVIVVPRDVEIEVRIFRIKCRNIHSDLVLALEAVHAHRLPFWDAMLWASAQRAGVRHMLSEDFQDGFELQDVTFINPFTPENNQLIDKLLPQS